MQPKKDKNQRWRGGRHPERGDHGNHETAEAETRERERRDGRDVCLGNTHIMDQRVTFSTN